MFGGFLLRSWPYVKTLLLILPLVLDLGISGELAWGGERERSVFVANEDSASISVIGGRAIEVTPTLQVDKGPHNLAVSLDRRFPLVTHPFKDRVTLVETRAWRVRTTIPMQGKPHGVTFTPDGRSAYLALGGRSKLVVIEPKNGVTKSEVSLERPPTMWPCLPTTDISG